MSEVVRLHPASGRKLSSWIAGFMEYTDHIQSPEPFRKWAAITAIAGALEQKIWIRSQNEILYPNLYVFLVGPPASGKTRALRAASTLWQELKETHHLAPVKLSKEGFIDALSRAQRVIGQTHIFNSLLVAAGELGALIPGYDADFMNALTYIYDNDRYDEQFRNVHKGEPLVIEHPQVNLLACCTPSFLTELMPLAAWEQGFLSRVVIVYSSHSELQPLDLLGELKTHTSPLGAALSHDIKAIGSDKNYRRLIFTREAADCIEAWHMNRSTAPTHPRLANYNTRRTTHLLKLCMVAAMDRHDAEVIELEDVRSAQDWLAEAEAHMSDIFYAMASGGDAQIMNELQHYIRIMNARTKKGVPSHDVHRWLNQNAPVLSHRGILEQMRRAKMITSNIEAGVELYWASDSFTIKM